jgi:hypothetical protein
VQEQKERFRGACRRKVYKRRSRSTQGYSLLVTSKSGSTIAVTAAIAPIGTDMGLQRKYLEQGFEGCPIEESFCELKEIRVVCIIA